MNSDFKTFLLFIFVSILLSACSYKEGIYPKQDKNGRFEVSIPDFLSSTKRLSEVSEFQFQNRFRTFYLIVIESSIQEIEKTIDEFAVNEIRILRENVDSISTDTVFYQNIHSLPAKHYSADLYLGKELFFYRLAFIEAQDTYYTLVIWTLESRKEEYGEMIEEIVYSFKLL